MCPLFDNLQTQLNIYNLEASTFPIVKSEKLEKELKPQIVWTW
jgi:hypothetical protein